MAGKKMRSRSGHKARYANYRSENRLAKNKKRKAERHEKRLAKQSERKKQRLALLNKAQEKTKLNSFQLAIKYGTLNIRRLTDIVDGTADNKRWFKLRSEKLQENANERKLRVRKRESRMRLSKDRDKTKKISK